MTQRHALWCTLLLVTVIVIGCGTTQPQAPTSPPPTAAPTKQPEPTPESAPPAGEAFQAQQAAGLAAYEESCTNCHGANLEDGFSAKLSRAALANYGTALQLYEYLRAAMPKGNAGSLSNQEYYDITGYILFRQELLPEGQVVSADSAASIELSD